MAIPQAEYTADLVAQLLTLLDPTRPSRKLQLELRRLVPKPLESFEDFERFAHADLVDATPAAKAWESMQLRTACAGGDMDRIPRWVLERLERLAA